MADQELTDLSVLAVLATNDLFFVRDTSAGIDKQVAVSSLISLLPPKDLGDLGDVDLTTSTPNPGDHLEFDGTDWVPGAAGSTTFISHADTPGVYAGAAGKFLKVNLTPDAVEFAALALGDLPAIGLNDLTDVDVTTITPSPGDMLAFNGSLWVPASGMAPGAHASTHISAGTDEIDGDRLDIDFAPTNYTQDTSPAEVTLADELTAHLAGIDIRLGQTFTPSSHSHDTSDITSGTFADARIAESNVTQHEAAINHDVLLNFVANEHVDHSTVTLTAGVGLSGGGTIAADRTFDLDIPGLPDDAAPDGSYTLAVYDGVSTHKEVTLTNLLSVGGFLTVEVNDLSSAVTWANVPNANITESSVTQHQAALSIMESQISDLQAYLLNINSESINELSDVDTSTVTPTTGDILQWNNTHWVPVASDTPGLHASTHVSGGGDEIDGDVLDISFIPTNYTRSTAPGEVTAVVELTAHLAGIDDEIATINSTFTGHTHAAADVISGTFADARIAQSSITQHEAAINHDVLLNFVANEHVDHTSVVLTAGIGLSGGGDITDNRTFDLDIPGLPDDALPVGTYTLAVHDGTIHKEVTLTNLLGVGGFLTAEVNDLTSAVTWANVPDANITESSVTQHEAALSITESQISDLGDYVLPADSIDILADVDTTTVTPLNGDVLAYNGTNWIPASAMAPGAHASTHISLGSDEIDGDVLDINFVPSNYTRSTSPTEVTTVVELTAHLAGIDTRLGGTFTPSSHTHVEADITDLQAYLLNITGEDFTDLSDTPVTYSGSGAMFVRVNVGETVLEFVDLTSGDLPSHTHVEADITDLQSYSLVGHTHVEVDITDLTKTIITQDEGITVTGGPHNTLNFVGAGVVAIDAGGGVTTITIAGGSGVSALDDLSDVTLSGPASGDFLRHNGAGQFVNTTIADGDVPNTLTLNTIITFAASSTLFEDDLSNLRFRIGAQVGAPRNNIAVESGSATNPIPIMRAEGLDTDVSMKLITKGSGTFQLFPNNVAGAAGLLGLDASGNILFAQAAAVAIDDLTDVTISGVVDGELLRFNGSIWINNTLSEAGIAAASHTHLEADITDLQAYLLNITGESIGDLSDVALGTPVDGEFLRFNGTSWVDAVISEADISDLTHAITLQDEGTGVANTPHPTLNFVGAGVAVTDAGSGVATVTIAGSGASADHDTQTATATTTTSTNSGTFIDVPNMTLTTKNLSEAGTYSITFSAYANNQKPERTARYRIVVGGVPQDEFLHSSQKKASDETTFSLTQIVSGVANGTVIKVQFLVDDVTGAVNLFTRALTIIGIPDSRVVA